MDGPEALVRPGRDEELDVGDRQRHAPARDHRQEHADRPLVERDAEDALAPELGLGGEDRLYLGPGAALGERQVPRVLDREHGAHQQLGLG